MRKNNNKNNNSVKSTEGNVSKHTTNDASGKKITIITFFIFVVILL